MAAKWRGKKSARRVLRKLTGRQDDLRSRPSPQVNAALRRHHKDIADILAGEKVVVRAKAAGKAARLRAAGARPIRGGRFVVRTRETGKTSFNEYLGQVGYHKDYAEHSERMPYLDLAGNLKHAHFSGRNWMFVMIWRGAVEKENWEAVESMKNVRLVDDRGVEIKLCTDPDVIKEALKIDEVAYELAYHS